MGHAYEPGVFVEEPFVLVEQETSVVTHRDDADDNAPTFAEQLPGDDVTVVFHRGDDDFVAFRHAGLSEG